MRVSLFEIEELEPLQAVAKKFDTEFILFGSVVRRLVKGILNKKYSHVPASLFDLVPLLGDIDLVHSGSERSNLRIVREIYREVPYSDSFRWQIMSARTRKIYARAQRSNLVIPATQLELSSSRGLHDPLEGVYDLTEDLYRCERNPSYHDSPLWREKRDLEFFGGILYLRLLLENPDARHFKDQPGWNNVVNVFTAANSPDVIESMKEGASLRTRLRYLLKGTWAAGSTALVEEIVSASGLKSLLKKIDKSLGLSELAGFSSEVQLISRECRVSSAHIEEDKFRLPHFVQGWTDKGEANRLIDSVARQSDFRYLNPELISGTEIDYSSEQFISASPLMTLDEGTSTSSYEGFAGPKPVSGPRNRPRRGGVDAGSFELGSISMGKSGDLGSVKATLSSLSQGLTDYFSDFAKSITSLGSGTRERRGKRSQEFVHFIIPYPAEIDSEDARDLGVILVLRCDGATYLLPLPSVCEALMEDDNVKKRLGIRINCGGLLERIGEITNKATDDVSMLVFLTERQKIATKIKWF